MSDFNERKKLLDYLGVKYTLETEWKPKRHTVNVFSTVDLLGPLTPDDWVRLCMKEGSDYIGGCCGNTSAIQDIINHWFRFDSGRVNINDISDVMQALSDHDGESEWTLPKESLKESVEWAKENWDQLRPLKKIHIIWHIVKDNYLPKVPMGYGDHLSEVDKAINVVEKSCRMISWDRLFGNDEDNADQKDANKTELLSRMMPALKILWENIEDMSPQPFNGFALFDINADSVCSDRLGLCIYRTEEEAKRIIDLWDEQEKEYEHEPPNDPARERVRVRPVRVTIENGVQFTDE